MRFWTAHLRNTEDEPLLVREGFAFGALIFGPLWLVLHRAWIPAALSLAVSILFAVLLPAPAGAALIAALALWLGLCGHDLRRWSMRHRGFILTHVVAAHTEAEALGRLLTARPDLAGRFMPARNA